ncbi:MAG TPA: hypothetical protein VIM61_13715 [Chthoniobacterales bacterium]|jgi:hypothetical protein
MIFRATFVLLASALAGLSTAAAASPETYQRTEDFSTNPKNWKVFHPIQFYGYERTSHTGTKGEAGGLFQPKPYYNYYADAYLNGAMSRGTRITAAGRIHFDGLSDDPAYTNSVYICHFHRGTDGTINTLGLALTGQNGTAVLANAIIQFSDGTAYIGNSVKLPVSATDPYMEWNYTWDPSGGTQGFGSLIVEIDGLTSKINLTKATVGLDFSVNTFGLFQPPFVAPNSNTFLQLDIGHLVYSALVGGPPSVRIKGPNRIKASTSKVAIAGKATIGLGNRVTSVRYRVVKNGKVGRFQNATGTTDWTATIKVPHGTSHIEVRAVGDNGLVADDSVKVKRTK